MLYPGEIAALWHLPHEQYEASKIAWAGVALPEGLTGDEAAQDGDRMTIGTAVGPGRGQTVHLTNADRAYHLYTSGQTGMGKSTLLHHLIHQDIAAGRGVAVLDPHGKLIDDLLAFSRVGSQGKPFEPTNCGDVMEQVIADLEEAIKESQGGVTWESLPTVMADATQLTQLLRNLVSNGIKFRGEAAPHVHISAELANSGAGLSEGQKDAWEEWLFSVRDNGIGIASKHYERVFQMFERLHHRSEYPGTGIGLAICQKIVERHGGRIWVESEPGEGSTFCFTIPSREGDDPGRWPSASRTP